MKDLIIISSIMLISILFSYLTGAFIAADFNVGNWWVIGRVFDFVLFIVSVCSLFGCYGYYLDKKNKK